MIIQKKNINIILLNIALLFILGQFFSCKTYQKNILFKTKTELIPASVEKASAEAEKNYIIQENDLLKIEVFTHKGELIVDPNFDLQQQNKLQYQDEKEYSYLVRSDGFVKLPVVENVKLEGLTIYEAEERLQKAYADYYKDPFVMVRFHNKRVLLLGALGGQVIPLTNENINLIEVLAVGGGLDNNAKAHNIRIIRGDLQDPEVRIIDLSTIEGMRVANLKILPGDIIYVEPVRKPVSESVREIAPILSLLTSLVTLVIVIQSLGN